MAVTASLFGNSLKHFVQGDIAYLTDTIKVMLLDNAYVFDQDAQEHRGHIVANEIAAGAGYTTRGVALAAKSVTYTGADNRTRLFAENTFWTPASGESLTASHGVIYKDTGTDTTSWLIGHVNFGTAITATGAPFTIDWNDTDGLLFLTAA